MEDRRQQQCHDYLAGLSSLYGRTWHNWCGTCRTLRSRVASGGRILAQCEDDKVVWSMRRLPQAAASWAQGQAWQRQSGICPLRNVHHEIGRSCAFRVKEVVGGSITIVANEDKWHGLVAGLCIIVGDSGVSTAIRDQKHVNLNRFASPDSGTPPASAATGT